MHQTLISSHAAKAPSGFDGIHDTLFGEDSIHEGMSELEPHRRHLAMAARSGVIVGAHPGNVQHVFEEPLDTLSFESVGNSFLSFVL